MGDIKTSCNTDDRIALKGFSSVSDMRLIFDAAFEGVCLLDTRCRFVYVNPAFGRILGGSPAQMNGGRLVEWLEPVAASFIRTRFCRILKNDNNDRFRHVVKALDGRTLDLEFSGRALLDQNGKPVTILVHVMERGALESPIMVRQGEEREELFREAEQKYRAIVEAQSEYIERFRPDFTITYVNEAYCRYFGEAAEELIGGDFRHHMFPDDIAEMEAEMTRLTPEHPTETAEERSRLKNGDICWTQWVDTGIFNDRGELVEIQAVGRDVTEMKLLEQELRLQRDKVERYLDVAGVMVVAFDPEGRIRMINGEGCRLLGAEREDLLGLPWCDHFVPPSCREDVRRLLLQGPTGDLDSSCVHQNRVIDCHGRERHFQWRNMPLFDERGVFQGLLSSGMDVTRREKDKEALQVSKKELQESLARLEETWENTVEVLSQATELRDPYTAGHQKEVAHIAVAVARELGLSGERVQAVRMAALLHDIGKLAIPAEILSKPGKLREVEFNLIRCHSQAAAEIIEKAGFPWDLAEIVRQHHERMDGSGYPGGLKGEEILLEARILAVADVVEAISSHRPYRPALGLDVAMKEIRENSGVLYDASVVQACLNVFRGICPVVD